MPELPEVEFAARNLRRWLVDRTVEAAHAANTRIFRGSDPELFETSFVGSACTSAQRRGKLLLLAFDNGLGFLSHLGMTGKWLRRPVGETPRHSRAHLRLAGDDVVHYVDPRLFGRIQVGKTAELAALPELRALGPDPWEDGIDPLALHARLQRTSRAIKVALMDQAILAGLGNIQATEALFLAKIPPEQPANTLGIEKTKALAEAILESLANTLRAMGEGEDASYLEDGGGVENPFLVYGKAGQRCPRCGTTLEKMRQSGRTTTFCPFCQH